MTKNEKKQPLSIDWIVKTTSEGSEKKAQIRIGFLNSLTIETFNEYVEIGRLLTDNIDNAMNFFEGVAEKQSPKKRRSK